MSEQDGDCAGGDGGAPQRTAVRKDLLADGLAGFLDRQARPDPPVVQRLRQATARLPEAYFQMSPVQAGLLTVLLRATGARRFLEIGTFTGLTALTAALAMPADGSVVTLDIDPHFPGIGQPFWVEAGVAARIRLMLGPARTSLAGLREAAETFDVALIDADKEGYPDYYEAALGLLRPGGLVLLDNMLWRGRVHDAQDQGSKPRLFRDLLRTLRDDPRVDASLLPLGDGLVLACKRG